MNEYVLKEKDKNKFMKMIYEWVIVTAVLCFISGFFLAKAFM